MEAIEQELGRALVDVAEQTEIPSLDAEALVLAGRREIHRSRVRGAWWSVASVAAAAVVVAGTSLAVRWTDSSTPLPHHHDQIATHGPTTAPPTGPPTLASLAHGAVPTIPYWYNGVYYLGDYQRRMATPPDTIQSVNGTTLVRRVDGRTALSEVYLVDGQRLVLLTSAATTWPAISSDGHLAAWVTPGQGSVRRLILWNLVTDRQAAMQEYTSHARHSEDRSDPVGIDEQGRVYVWDNGFPLIWDPATHVTGEILGLPKQQRSKLAGATPDGPVLLDGASADLGNGGSIYGTVDAGRVFHRVGRFPALHDVWSPDGAYVMTEPMQGAMAVRSTVTRARVPLGLPSGGHATFTVWEDATHLLVTMRSGGHTYWIRCDVVNGHAEIAKVLPGNRVKLVLPQ